MLWWKAPCLQDICEGEGKEEGEQGKKEFQLVVTDIRPPSCNAEHSLNSVSTHFAKIYGRIIIL
jgi:hypothetical protein